MLIVIEVVATNMDTGHVSTSQHTVDLSKHHPEYNEKETHDYYMKVKQTLIDNNQMGAQKVGPVLINRNYTFFV